MWNLYIICILYFILSGCVCWFVSDFPNIIIGIISIVTIFIWHKINKNFQVKITSTFIVSFCGLIFVHFVANDFKFLGSFLFAINIFALSTPFFISTSNQTKLLKVINNFLFIFVFASLCVHVLKNLNLLPEVAFFERGAYSYQNYYIYLYSLTYENKCCGFCYEPGFFSLLLSALLLINRYDMEKWCTRIYLIALILTFSLGGYVLTAVCWYLYYILTQRKKITTVIRGIIALVFLGIIYYVCTEIWNNGNNIVNELIFEKLNRAGSYDSLFESRQNIDAILLWNQFISSDHLAWGYGFELYGKLKNSVEQYDAASIIEFIIATGFIGTIIQIFSVMIISLHNMDRRYSIPGYSLLLLDFLQHGYNVQTSMFLLIILWIQLSSKSENDVALT